MSISGDRLFGWKPVVGTLETVRGIDGALVDLRQARARVNASMMMRAESQRAPYIDEMRRLAELEFELKRLRTSKHHLLDQEHDQFGIAFRKLVKERLGVDAFRALVAEAQERADRLNAIPSTAANGPVLEPRSTGGGMKARR